MGNRFWIGENQVSGHHQSQDHQRYGHARSEEHTSELQSHRDIVCRLLLEKKKNHVAVFGRMGGDHTPIQDEQAPLLMLLVTVSILMVVGQCEGVLLGRLSYISVMLHAPFT